MHNIIIRPLTCCHITHTRTKIWWWWAYKPTCPKIKTWLWYQLIHYAVMGYIINKHSTHNSSTNQGNSRICRKINENSTFVLVQFPVWWRVAFWYVLSNTYKTMRSKQKLVGCINKVSLWCLSQILINKYLGIWEHMNIRESREFWYLE
jgi:hypothetical protein